MQNMVVGIMRVVETLPSSPAHLLWAAAAVSGETRQMNGGRTSATTAALRRPDTARGAAGGHQGRGGAGSGRGHSALTALPENGQLSTKPRTVNTSVPELLTKIST